MHGHSSELTRPVLPSQHVPDNKNATRMTAETFLRLHNYDEAWRVFDRVAELGTKVRHLKSVVPTKRRIIQGEKQ